MANRVAFKSVSYFSEKNIVVKKTVQKVIENLRENYRKFEKVTDQDLIALSSIFGDTLEKALEIVEENKVTYFYTTTDNIGIYQVVKMNDRKDWNNKNAYLEQCAYPPSTMPSLFNVSPNNWVHVPPQTMPWGIPAVTQPSVVRFTAGDFTSHPFKRKCEPSSDKVPAKILVTEEKMAAHMKGLHISDVEIETQDVTTSANFNEEFMEAEKLPKLVVCDEIKNMKSDLILPESILRRLEKPEMALVLWQPPPADLGGKLNEINKLSKLKESEREKPKEEKEEEEEGGGDKEMEVESKEEKIMDVAMEAEMENKIIDSTFRPINPVPMPTMGAQFFQPIPQFHGYSPFQKSSTTFYN